MQALADRLAAHFCPRTRAYHEIWLTDPTAARKQLVAGGNGQRAQRPGRRRADLRQDLPAAEVQDGDRLPGDNCVDMYANDLGFMAICEDVEIVGYNVLVGGGMGVTPSAKKTFPARRQADRFVRPDEVDRRGRGRHQGAARFRQPRRPQAGPPEVRDRQLGHAKFKAKVEEYYGGPLADPHPDDVCGFNDHMGWDEQGDGRWFYGLNIENGRIKDHEDCELKTALREICTTLRPGIRLTSPPEHPVHRHSAGRSPATGRHPRPPRREAHRGDFHRPPLVDGLRRLADLRPVDHRKRAGPARHHRPGRSRAGAARPVERTIHGPHDRLPQRLRRPYNCDIGLVGKAAGKYTIFLGGRLLGDRLNFIYKDMVPEEEVVATLAPVFVLFQAGPRARRNARRLLPPQRRRRPARVRRSIRGRTCWRKSIFPSAAW